MGALVSAGDGGCAGGGPLAALVSGGVEGSSGGGLSVALSDGPSSSTSGCPVLIWLMRSNTVTWLPLPAMERQ